DVDGDPLTSVLVSTTTKGVLALNANGSFTYTPGANFHGTDSFTYKARDGISDSNTVTVTITVDSVNDAPAGTTATLATNEDTPLVFGTAAFGFTDPNDTPANALLAVQIVSLPAAGAFTLNGAAVTAGQVVTAVDIAAGR